VSRLHGGYRLGTSDGMAYGIETQGGSMCALGPDAPSAVLWGWCEMFEVERGAIGLIGVMGFTRPLHSGHLMISGRFLRASWTEIFVDLLSLDHTIIENRLHFALRLLARPPQETTRFARPARLASLRQADS
jgi:hypothetical protein